MTVVAWHDLECGAYVADLPLWRELARSPVLDLGAGTGRVALDLAQGGYEVVALDLDDELLAALRERAGGLPITTVVGDARSFALDRTFATVLCPMQTVQLLGGGDARASLLRCAFEHLEPGGLLACALADAREGLPDGPIEDLGVLPDMREDPDGTLWSSLPVALRDEGDAVAIERVREHVTPAGERTTSRDVVRLDHLSAALLEHEAAGAGFTVLPRRRIGATDDHVGSDVVVLAR